MTNPQTSDPVKSTSILRGLPIQQRLPLLICVLLLSTVIAVGIASYIGIKQSSLRIAGDRLKTVAEQLSILYGQSARNAILATRVVANDETVRNYLQSPGSVPDSMVRSVLWKLQSDTQSMYVELLDTQQQTLLRAGKKGIETGIDNRTVLNDLRLRPDSSGVSKMYRSGDSLFYVIVCAVLDEKQSAGYLLRWRLAFTTKETIQQFSQLLGTDAVLYVGNMDMSSWSDLAKITTGPPVNIKNDEKFFTYHRSGTGPVIATARPIGNTEWILLVEFPQRTILSAASNYAGWILIIGGIITLTGIIIAWFMSRNITRPLKKLMDATTAIASGDYNVAVASDRRDEVGGLARSFNKMSEQIKNATKNLEQKVIERTAQLEAVNKEAEEAQQQHIQQKLINETSIKVQERVREEIGRELHDNINQLLAASKLYMDYAINKDGIRSEKLEQSRGNISRAIEEIRKISKALVAPSLGDETLEEVIEDLLRDIRHTTSLKVKLVTYNYNEAAISDEIKLALYRIVQEQMNNILKHANAGNVTISLTTANGEARLSIEDDGAGFDTSKNSSGIGLRNIATRASHYDGEVSIYSSTGNGCTLEVMIPM